MNTLVKTLTIVGAGVLLGGDAGAVIPDKYQTILDRNAFGLLPPVVVTETNKPVEPPANLKVTGFATIGGERRVYFTIPPKDPKDVQQYLTLSEGQREGSLEVVTISEELGEVSIRNGNVDMVLSLKKDGFQPAKVAPGMNPQPMPLGPAPGTQASSPVYTPAAHSTGMATPGMQQTSGNPPPVPQMVNPNVNVQNGDMQQSGAPAVRTIPTRTLRVPPVQQSSPGPQSSSFNGAPVVYDPNPVNDTGNAGNDGPPAIDPAIQLAAMKEYENARIGNNGLIPGGPPPAQPNIGPVYSPPVRNRNLPAPPSPPIP